MSREPLSPYLGLTPFEDSEHDVRFFFGREREQELIEANLMASRLTVLYGETGVGKSSVLRAGVAHRLRSAAAERLRAGAEPELAVVVFEGWRDDPLTRLRAAIGDAVTRALGGSLPTPAAEGSLADALHLWGDVLGGDLYVILDQVEEYFLYHGSSGGPGTLLAELPEAVNDPDLRVSFLLAVREDALAKLDVLKGRIPNVLGNYLRLRHLDREAARSAIVGPLGELNRMVGEDEAVEIEDALVDAVLDQVAAGKVDLGRSGRGAVDGGDGAAGIETPFLQLVMQRLWDEEQAAGSRVLRLETLERLGGAEQVVRDHVDSALVALSPAEQDLVAALLDHLVTPSGTKIAHGVADLAAYAGTDEATLAPVLESLGAKRILRPVAGGASGGPGYEIFHDVLAQPVLAWKAAHETGRKLERQRAEAAKRHRRLYAVIGVAVVALALMSGLAAYALVQRSHSEANRKSTEEASQKIAVVSARGLASMSLANRLSDPEQALVDARNSVVLHRTEQGLRALRESFVSLRTIAVLGRRDVIRISVVDAQHRVVTVDSNGTASVWRMDGKVVYSLKRKPHLVFATLGPGGEPLTASSEGLRLWRAADGAERGLVPLAGLTAASVVSRKPGTTMLATGQENGTVTLWSTDGRSIERVSDLETGCPVAGVTEKWRGGLVLVRCRDSRGGPLLSSHRWMLLLSPAQSRLNGLVVRSLRSDLYDVTVASLAPDGTRFLIGTADRGLTIRSLVGEGDVELADSGEETVSARFSPDGQRLAAVDHNGVVRLWDSRSGRLLWSRQWSAASVAFRNDGRQLLIGGRNGGALVVSAASKRLRALTGRSAPVKAIALGRDGDIAVTVSVDGRALLWRSGPELRELGETESPLQSATPVAGGRRLLLVDGKGARLVTVPTRTGLRMGRGGRQPTLSIRGRGAPVSAVASANGKEIAALYADGVIRLWQARAASTLPERTVRGIWSKVLAVGDDGEVAAVTRSNEIRIGDRPRIPGHVTRAAFRRYSRWIATVRGSALTVWNGETLRVHEFDPSRQRSATIESVEFDPERRAQVRVLTASSDGEVRIWTVGSGASVTLPGGSSILSKASFSPDGRWVVSAGTGGAQLVGVYDGLVLRLRGHTGPVTSAAFGADGRSIITAGVDRTVRTYRCEVCGNAAQVLAAADARLAMLHRGQRAKASTTGG